MKKQKYTLVYDGADIVKKIEKAINKMGNNTVYCNNTKINICTLLPDDLCYIVDVLLKARILIELQKDNNKVFYLSSKK